MQEDGSFLVLFLQNVQLRRRLTLSVLSDG